MHPGFLHWWKQAQARGHGGGCYASAGRGPGADTSESPSERYEAYVSGETDGGGAFGVRRPLRFMAHKLDLDERQVGELAAILDALKTERAQAAVDHRRSIGAFAEAVGGPSFDDARARDAATLRVRSAERLRDAVVDALAKTHAMLDDEQRKQLAYLLRSGALTI